MRHHMQLKLTSVYWPHFSLEHSEECEASSSNSCASR